MGLLLSSHVHLPVAAVPSRFPDSKDFQPTGVTMVMDMVDYLAVL